MRQTKIIAVVGARPEFVKATAATLPPHRPADLYGDGRAAGMVAALGLARSRALERPSGRRLKGV